jgi:ABC-type multidrug transport system fused ATPase/permease subunit
MFRIFDTGMLTAVLAVILINSDISASTTGFLISFVEGLSISLNWALLDLRNIELDGISLERLADFRAIKQEERNSDVIIEESWPSQGIIRATNLCARYEHDLPDILHNISFDVQGGTKVGIVGASGGGKSTLAKTLFSFVQVSGGNIEIDGVGEYSILCPDHAHMLWTPTEGVDISTINLSKLRSSLGIISQDPILLSGSLRLNLDIESQYSDADLYEALRQVQLIKVAGSKAVTPAVSRAPSVRISENGEDDGVSASDTAVGSEVAAEDATIFNDLDFQIKTGGEK